MTGVSGDNSDTPATRADVDLRVLVASPIADQGVRPLCLPITMSHAHEAATAAKREGIAMAPEAIWWACTKMHQVTATGMLLEHAGTALRLSGQPPLSHWPWNPHLGIGTEGPPSSAGKPPWSTAELVQIQVAHDGIEDEIEDALAAGLTVVLTVELTHAFEYPDEDGSIAVPDIRSPAGDYHAVLVVGAVTDATHARRLLIRNSWGDFWGAGGFGWLPLDYLVANAVQAAVVVPT